MLPQEHQREHFAWVGTFSKTWSHNRWRKLEEWLKERWEWWYDEETKNGAKVVLRGIGVVFYGGDRERMLGGSWYFLEWGEWYGKVGEHRWYGSVLLYSIFFIF